MFNKLVFVLVFIIVNSTYAQTITGVVTDQSKQEPIEDIGVYNIESGKNVFTSAAGEYHIDGVAVGEILQFYGLGYETKEVTVTNDMFKNGLDVQLKDEGVSLDQIVLNSKVNLLSTIVNVDVENSPVKSSQDILRKVPGLIIGQHAGGGKAEQLFLRGFDVDHGTDISIEVDGLPVNLPSHAHGQGYADLHFVIPETIKNIDFGKGPYYADKGNFNTAGYVELKTKKSIDKNVFTVEAGQFNTLRAVSLIKLLESNYSDAYVASELVLTDGPFNSPQDFNRFNVLGRYSYNNLDDEELTLSLSHFQSKWNASGQIPQRAVDAGIIDRFGAIDDTEGGITSRSNILVNHKKEINEHETITSKAFISRYNFELYSNFTFFLEDPVNGDQIRQKEARTIIGASTDYKYDFDLKDQDASLYLNAGLGFRYDDNNDVELSKTRNRRETLERIAFGDIDETNAYAYLQGNFKKNKWTINPGVRLDFFKFNYNNFLSDTFDPQSEDDVIVSPKLNTIYQASSKVQLFAKAGFGFHSNDTRVVTANTGEETLPSAFGADLGTILKPTKNIVVNAALWSLFSEQEFVYVGDAGVVEPSGKSRRLGVDFGVRYQFTDWLYANADINYTYARSTEEPDGQDLIPLAPDLTSSGGIFLNNFKNFSGGLSYKFLDDRAANEDNSIVAPGYFVTDFNLNYAINQHLSLGVIIENLFDVEWNETQFATETRLFNEAAPVEEITFTPGTPFSARAKLSFSF